MSKTNSSANPYGFPKLTAKRLQELIARLLSTDNDDESALMVIELTSGLVFEDDRLERESLGLTAIQTAYSHSRDFDTSLDAFIRENQQAA